MKFEAEEENKLEYTDIHKQYEKLIEDELVKQLGAEKMQKIEEGISTYTEAEHKEKNEDIYNALQLLCCLSDF